jgi:hypothetical protein
MRRWLPWLLVLTLAGCSPLQPPAEPDFTLSRRFLASYDRVWAAVIAALAADGVPAVATDRPAGHITSDLRPLYGRVPGNKNGEAGPVRVAYRIGVIRTERGTRVTISPLIEVTTQRFFRGSGSGTVPWHDATSQNPGLAQALTGELFAAVRARLAAQPGT